MNISIVIKTGNDAVQTSDDIADILVNLAGRIRQKNFHQYNGIKIMDANGNSVGYVNTTE